MLFQSTVFPDCLIFLYFSTLSSGHRIAGINDLTTYARWIGSDTPRTASRWDQPPRTHRTRSTLQRRSITLPSTHPILLPQIPPKTKKKRKYIYTCVRILPIETIIARSDLSYCLCTSDAQLTQEG